MEGRGDLPKQRMRPGSRKTTLQRTPRDSVTRSRRARRDSPTWSSGGSVLAGEFHGGFKPAVLRTLRLCRCRCGTHRPPLLKTFSAIDRTPLGGLERNRSFFPTLRTHGLGFDPLCANRTVALRAMSFACLAPLGLVLETLVGEKHLLAGGKDELTSALAALQDLIVVFHTLLRPGVGNRTGSASAGARQTGESGSKHRVPTRWLARSCWE